MENNQLHNHGDAFETELQSLLKECETFMESVQDETNVLDPIYQVIPKVENQNVTVRRSKRKKEGDKLSVEVPAPKSLKQTPVKKSSLGKECAAKKLDYPDPNQSTLNDIVSASSISNEQETLAPELNEPEPSNPSNNHVKSKVEPMIQSIIEAISGLQKSQEEIIERQKVQEELLKELNSSLQRLEGKANSALSSKDSLEMPLETELVSLLPVSSSNLGSFEDKVKSCGALRLQIKKILLGCYGRDPRGLVSSCMRRILADDVGLTYSLTGRNKHGGSKLSFEGTAVYDLIREVCLATFDGHKENVVRDAVSDWLLQAKFRIARRGKTSVKEFQTPK